MKVLFVSPCLPGPPIFGGQRRIHGLMTQLAKDHELSVLALVDGYLDHRVGIEDTKTYCREVITVPDTLHRISGSKKRALQFATLVSPWSWEHWIYKRPAYQRALDEHLATRDYDVIVYEFVFMAMYEARARAGARRPRTVLDEHNVEFDLLRRTAETASRGRKVFNAIDAFKLEREEVAAWKRFDGTTFTSRRDEELARRLAPAARTAVVPNGADIDSFRPREGAKPIPKTLLFFGALNYFPNEEAVVYFAEKILPLIRARHPDVRFRAVGPVGEGPVMELKKQGVEVTGFVDDLKAEIENAAITVVPLRIGGGTRLKILEAMSMSKAIVSTRLGAEGIDVQHDRDILLADEPQSFADAVCRLIDDPATAERLGHAARQTVVDHYSWRASAQRMERLFESLLASSDSRAPVTT